MRFPAIGSVRKSSELLRKIASAKTDPTIWVTLLKISPRRTKHKAWRKPPGPEVVCSDHRGSDPDRW